MSLESSLCDDRQRHGCRDNRRVQIAELAILHVCCEVAGDRTKEWSKVLERHLRLSREAQERDTYEPHQFRRKGGHIDEEAQYLLQHDFRQMAF